MIDVHVVTGAAGDIALATIRRLPPGIVLACDRDLGRLKKQAEIIGADGRVVHTMACDITNPRDCAALHARSVELGRTASLINLAGLAPPNDADRIYAVNLFGLINLLDAFEEGGANDMVAVCVASVAGHRHRAATFDALLIDPPVDLRKRVEALAIEVAPSRLAYSVSKRGVIVQVRARTARWGEHGNRIVSISPGIVSDSAMGAGRKAVAHHGARTALGREASVADMANAIAFVVSEQGYFLSGTDLLVDGGFLALVDHSLPVDARDDWHAILT